MKRFLIILLSVSLLSACAGQPNPAPAAPAPQTSEPLPGSGSVTASAEIVPAQVSELSFPIPGLLKQVDVQPGESVRAGQPLATLDKPELEYAIRQAEAALASAQTDWDYYRVLRENKPPERRQEAEARLAAAQAALITARLTLAQATLTAPFDGTVVAVHLKAGEAANPGQAFIVLAALDQLQIETTDLSERYIALVETGQPAVVYIEALDNEFSGQVVCIAPRAGKKDGDTVYSVTVVLDEQPQGLRWGMSAEVRIEAGE